MAPLVVVSTAKVLPGEEAAAAAAFAAVAGPTHGEAGCLAYALHRGTDDPRTFVVIERWTSSVARENHLFQPYARDFGERLAGLLAEPLDVKVTEPVQAGDPVKGAL